MNEEHGSGCQEDPLADIFAAAQQVEGILASSMPKKAADCEVKFHTGETPENPWTGGRVPFTEILCDGYGAYVFERGGKWYATSRHIKEIAVEHYGGPPGPEFAEKMAKAWQAAADYIRAKEQEPQTVDEAATYVVDFYQDDTTGV